jgi:hypothetical protein
MKKTSSMLLTALMIVSIFAVQAPSQAFPVKFWQKKAKPAVETPAQKPVVETPAQKPVVKTTPVEKPVVKTTPAQKPVVTPTKK